MGCVLDMTAPPDVLLNQIHSYGNRLTTSSVADTDATDPHFLVVRDVCRFAGVGRQQTVHHSQWQEMMLNRCVEAEFSTFAS